MIMSKNTILRCALYIVLLVIITPIQVVYPIQNYERDEYGKIKTLQNISIINNAFPTDTKSKEILITLKNDIKQYPNNALILNYLASYSLFIYMSNSYIRTQQSLFAEYLQYSDLSWKYSNNLTGQQLVDYLFDYAIINAIIPTRHKYSERAILKLINNNTMNTLSTKEASILYACLYFFAINDNNIEKADYYQKAADDLDKASFGRFLNRLNTYNN